MSIVLPDPQYSAQWPLQVLEVRNSYYLIKWSRSFNWRPAVSHPPSLDLQIRFLTHTLPTAGATPASGATNPASTPTSSSGGSSDSNSNSNTNNVNVHVGAGQQAPSNPTKIIVGVTVPVVLLSALALWW